jgi:cellulose synthase/poly-beta-1,6-N-acetylglucosamine synthase-like glycosyltransferase
MSAASLSFWICLALVAYPYLLYPLLLALLVWLRGRPVRTKGARPRSVSFVVCAHNEEWCIQRRLRELTELLDAAGVEGEIILVSDGSTDATAEVARGFDNCPVRVLELPERVGKAAALSRGAALAGNEIIVFADVRQTWDAEALPRMLENFADPQVGAVSGDLRIRDACGVLQGVALYWRFEKLLRRLEGRLWSMACTTGAISAVWRRLFCPIPAGTLLDDVYWPLRVAMLGYRVIHEPQAVAYDQLPERALDEFRRKVRTLAGNFQLLWRLPAALLPWCNPIAWQLWSHKMARLVVPWALLAVAMLSVVLAGPLYRMALALQLWGYGVGLLGLFPAMARQSRLASAAASFLVLNGAAWMAFWVWLTGRSGRSWAKVTYRMPVVRMSDMTLAMSGTGEGGLR